MKLKDIVRVSKGTCVVCKMKPAQTVDRGREVCWKDYGAPIRKS
jgi:hypothetical protein